MKPRLSSLSQLQGGVQRPAYDPTAHGSGIVHLGLGAFHKAHQAVYTDAALAAEGGDWRIAGVSLRSTGAADALTPQNGLYTLIERGPDGVQARVIGSLSRAIAAVREPGEALLAMTDPATHIVSLTVTEKAYGIDRTTGALAPDRDADAASGVVGLIVDALRLRREAGARPFAVLCCDNLPHNGAFLRGGVLDFARRQDPGLADWIAGEVDFPSTMVDRITPAATEQTLADAARLTGCADHAAVETEPFTQWVIEDAFRGPRPLWEAGGALFVSNVAAYERMKLHMLNGTHSMLAYCGFLYGCSYVRDVMMIPELAALVRRHLSAAAATLNPLPGVDFTTYASELETRFANPALDHETYQIAMDGTEKMPQRLFEPAAESLARGGDVEPFAFAVAAWMRFCLGVTEAGETYALRDPQENRIRAALSGLGDAESISAALQSLPGFCPVTLQGNRRWRGQLETKLKRFLAEGVSAAISRELVG